MQSVSQFKQNTKIILSRKALGAALFIAGFVVISLMFMRYTWEISMKDTEEKAIQLATAAEAGISKLFVSKLNMEESTIDLHEYQDIRSSLMNLAKLNSNIRFAYIYTQKDGKIYFLADSEPAYSKDYSPPGQEYTEAPQDLFIPFKTGNAFVAGPVEDRWGRWMTALAPIKDLNTGEVVAVLGVDFPEDQWWDHAIIRTLQAFVLVMFLSLAIIAYYLLIRKNRLLKEEKVKFSGIYHQYRQSEALFASIFNQAPIGICIGRKDDLISGDDDMRQNTNTMFQKILGRSMEELRGLSWAEITHPEDLPKDLEKYNKFRSGEIPGYQLEKRYTKPDGSHVWVNMTIAPLQIENDDRYDHLCIIEDITKRKETEKALSESERSKSVLLSHIPGLAYRCNYDRDWTMQFVSDGCYKLTGYTPDELINNRKRSFNEVISPEYREILWREWERILALNIPFRYEYEITTVSGERKWVLELGQGVYDENGEVEALEGIVIDITENKMQEDQIHYLSDHDFLTNLYNRKFFEAEKMRLDLDENVLPLSIIIASINGMRLINGAFGTAVGDRVIVDAAKIIKSCCRENDVLARTAGDEFSVLMPNTNNEEAFAILEKIKSSCEMYNNSNKSRVNDISLSIGYATKTRMDESLEKVFKAAEEYMFNMKLLNRKSSHSTRVSSIMAAMYARSQETKEHAERLRDISNFIGERMQLSPKSLNELQLFAMLHDIGKIGIDDRILNNPCKLTPEEWSIMKRHPMIGYRIAMASPELEPIAEYILSHHERWDGTGYPHGLKGEEIPLLSRILAVADAYDAMTEDRIYRKAMTKEEAIEEIIGNAGTQFDPEVARTFIENIHLLDI